MAIISWGSYFIIQRISDLSALGGEVVLTSTPSICELQLLDSYKRNWYSIRLLCGRGNTFNFGFSALKLYLDDYICNT